MINEKLFNETIDKLVKAYFEGTLKHQDSCGCAVGNICGDMEWAFFFFTTNTAYGEPSGKVVRRIASHAQVDHLNSRVFPRYYKYSKQDLMDMEWAFETAPKEGDWEFNGLMQVVDVLERIHECDKEITTATKQRFVKQPL